jgi:hypothetical protein
MVEDVLGVQMKGLQNKLIISQKAFIIHIYGLHHYKGQLLQLFSDYITFSTNLNLGSLRGTTNIQMIFDLVPCYLKRPLCGLSGVEGH